MQNPNGARLLILASAPFRELDAGLLLDVKFVEGMRLHRSMWPGPVDVVLRRSGDVPIPFGAVYDPADLDFGMLLIDRTQIIDADILRHYDIVFCAGDAYETLHMASLCRRLDIKIVYSIEYAPKARFQIMCLDANRSMIRRAYSILWIGFQEIRRRQAFRRADGIQANGYPASKAYRGLNQNTMMYLDNRMKPHLFGSQAEIQTKALRLQGGGPLRLISSGRLESMKGSQDLVPIAIALRDMGVNFALDIFGEGSLRNEIARQIAQNELTQVTLHRAIDFETALVPVNRSNEDMFLSCHRQSDPSCTYLESMGCGLPIVGYANDMWTALQKESCGGWVSPVGNIAAIADQISSLSKNTNVITARSEAALAYAKTRDFETEFARRMEHLRAVVA